MDGIHALSPLDGRYRDKTGQLADRFSEAALIRARVEVEIRYLQHLSSNGVVRSLSAEEAALLDDVARVDDPMLAQVKALEETTRHDVKAVEYFLRERFQDTSLSDLSPYLHFGLTSEDVNNLAYRRMIAAAREAVLRPQLLRLLAALADLAETHRTQPMLARTHGQPAIPTTFGKEVALFGIRLLAQLRRLQQIDLFGKLNGAVGGYHAMVVAFPDVDWPGLARSFVESLGLRFLPYTAQINPQDDLVALFGVYRHLNTILLGLNQDMWRYISDDWLVQRMAEGQVGSSTMPQKVNPIQFENSEGNLALANALFQAFMTELPVSRLQRDLSDSTIRRNIGSAFGYSLIAYRSLLQGLASIDVNGPAMRQALNANWNILAEAMQTVARTQGDAEAYEQTAAALKQTVVDGDAWQRLATAVDGRLAALTPESYL
ncbi:MAG: adenylosuccinate lyase, partial [Candidatus Promineifilaceae bacterium]|nr:adenylosuccinate lyase [Candidatus Promineifilaceae bacterium]